GGTRLLRGRSLRRRGLRLRFAHGFLGRRLGRILSALPASPTLSSLASHALLAAHPSLATLSSSSALGATTPSCPTCLSPPDQTNNRLDLAKGLGVVEQHQGPLPGRGDYWSG